MRKLLVLLSLAVPLVAGVAFGQTSLDAPVTTTIVIPQRVALELTEPALTTINLDDGLPNWNGGGRTSGEGCLAFPSHYSDFVADGLIPVGTLGYADYPPFGSPTELEGIDIGVKEPHNTSGSAAVLHILSMNGLSEATSYPASGGTILCVTRVSASKFSNAPGGFTFRADVTMPEAMGKFGLLDFTADITDAAPEGDLRHLIDSDAFDLELLGQAGTGVSGTSGGWVEDEIVQLFWFDGSEMPTEETDDEITVTYTLTGNF